ncbi:tRNA glutamyl-Q(34) synthetase GluQRS [Maricaulis sp.]|uniref:tRNA glutamyl-Q(34) synthetase GluQRS n=1 Tax=Maricaulis sp. TaxID=1486257 RepID=UPI001B2C4239|nr:tRNA glutamyl-Q(34) synthetase GluQRS [Maricaulis sp.]MBO6796623.1 tRNA glutamyl-Q(34) synthetase GluQRS [Maricaulis sp.]
MTFRTRFAPSPSGHLHLGHAFSAWSAWRAAQDADGAFILRIEDIDTTRCKREFEQSIFDDLIWLGLDWPLPVRRQSDHFADYAGVLETLRAKDLVYRCFKTRKEILEEIARAPHGVGDVYRGPGEPVSEDEEAERVERGEAFAWRLSLDRCRDHLGGGFDRMMFHDLDHGDQAADPLPLGDVILARKDVGTSYHIAVVHDDALQDVTHVIRGEDLKDVTPLHVLLQTVLDLPTPSYQHHRLLLDESGKRFAKRDRAATLNAMRSDGLSAQHVLDGFRT